MQLYKASVRLKSGDLYTTDLPKENLTAADIIILRHLHGQDAVVNIRQTTISTVPYDKEVEKLERVYGEEIVRKLFDGGYEVKLPSKLRDSDLEPAGGPRKAPPTKDEAA